MAIAAATVIIADNDHGGLIGTWHEGASNKLRTTCEINWYDASDWEDGSELEIDVDSNPWNRSCRVYHVTSAAECRMRHGKNFIALQVGV